MKDVLTHYEKIKDLTPIPKVLTEVFSAHTYSDVYVLETPIFYPFSQETISQFNENNPPKESYGVHMWNYSWGPWYARVLHTFPMYYTFKRILDMLGIKIYIKKVLGLP